jgi:two-component system, cell cycle sensor histidine kinase and response regulator CckA
MRAVEMEGKQSKFKKANALRERAEKELKLTTIDAGKLPRGELLKLAHELQVYQIELEMQNDELRKSRLQLEESRQNYLDLFDNAPVGYLTLDENGTILEANLTVAEMLSSVAYLLVNSIFHHYIPRDDQDTFYVYLKKVFASEAQKHTCQIKLHGKDSIEFYARLDSIPKQDIDGNIACRTTVTDITEYRHKE